MAEPHNRSENMETRKIKEAGSRSPRKSDYARQLRLQIVHFYTIILDYDAVKRNIFSVNVPTH